MANFSLVLLFLVSLYVVVVAIVKCERVASAPFGYCGLAEFDVNQMTLERHGLKIDNDTDILKFQLEQVPPMYRPFVPKTSTLTNETSNYEAQQVPPGQRPADKVPFPARPMFISNNPIPMMYRVIYDASMEAEFPDKQEREDFIRDLMFSAQLIYEQPEFFAKVKLNLVVTSIEKLRTEFPVDYTASQMLTQIDKINPQSRLSPYWDITILLFRRNIFLVGDKESGNRLLGLATSACFCNRDPQRPPILAMNAFSANNAVTLAHELAHTLNIMHDGYIGSIESRCRDDQFIMTPYAAPGRLLWSNCSADAALAHLTNDIIFNCAYSPERLALAKHVNEKFFFQVGSARRPYPGERNSLDRQCQLAVDKIAKESVKSHGPSSLGVCKALYCEVDHSQTYIGPALFGSNCTIWGSNDTGLCIHTMCSRVLGPHTERSLN